MSSFDPDLFADWLTEAFKRSEFKSFSALAEKAKLSRSAVSALANAKKQPLTNKPSQPKAETAISLAKALREDVDKVLLLAGHAPLESSETSGWFKGLDKLSPDDQKRAKRQIRAIIDSYLEEIEENGEDDEDFKYL